MVESAISAEARRLNNWPWDFGKYKFFLVFLRYILLLVGGSSNQIHRSLDGHYSHFPLA